MTDAKIKTRKIKTRKIRTRNVRTLGAALLLSAGIAAPVFARSNYRVPDDQNFRGAYNQSNAQFYAQPLTNKERDNIEDIGFSGRDPSRVGGEDPYLHPGG